MKKTLKQKGQYSWGQVDVTPIIGAKILAVEVTPLPDDYDTDLATSDLVLLHFEGLPAALELSLNGDCCSRSCWADVKQFDELVGARIQDIELRDGPREGDDYDIVQWHFLVFTTDKGHVTIDWRNESNGYYDGNLGAEWRMVLRG